MARSARKTVAAGRRRGACAARGCGMPAHYPVSDRRSMCAVHAAITLLARAVSEALAADNAKGGR